MNAQETKIVNTMLARAAFNEQKPLEAHGTHESKHVVRVRLRCDRGEQVWPHVPKAAAVRIIKALNEEIKSERRTNNT